MKKLFFFAVLVIAGVALAYFSACTKEKAIDDYQQIIGAQYNIYTSNIHEIPESILAKTPSDVLFGTAEDKTMMITEVEDTATNVLTPATDIKIGAEERGAGRGPYTWFSHAAGHNMVYNWDMYLKIENDGGLPATNDQSRLVFWAIQTNFGDANGVEHGAQGAHAGLQWWGAKKANWGGYWNGSIPYANTINFAWLTGREYRVRVWRTGLSGSTQYWGCWIQDMVSGIETYLGQFPTSSINAWITSQVIWTETYGSVCNKNLRASFNRLQYRCANAAGVFPASHATAVYGSSGTCPSSTNSNITRTGSAPWFGARHTFNTVRTTADNTALW